jgi:folate-binding protein YgfZ
MNFCHLSHRNVIRLSGDDRRDFLQGLISNDIHLCTPDHPIYAALLTPQGKFVHDFFVHDDNNSFLIDCETLRTDDLIQRLSAYKLRTQISLERVPDINVGAAWGPDLAKILPILDAKISMAPDPRRSDLGWRLLVPKNANLDAFQIVSFVEYDRHRLLLGVPDGSRDMEIGKSTLLEATIDHLNGISWTKGCYIGQELTARMHYRALMKKRLYPVRITGTEAALGTLIYVGEHEIGEMRSACGDVGLALLKCDIAESKDEPATLRCGDSTLRVLSK